MLPESALQNMFPVIITPSHDGKYFHNYILSLLNFTAHATRINLNMQVLLHRGESLITRARNNAVTDFLANKQWTHLFWIDSDIGFSVQAAIRLLLADRDIACGVYPLKYENWPANGEGVHEGMTQAEFEAKFTRYTVNTSLRDDTGTVHLNIDEDGFFAVDEAPTGFMCIKRNVFERMMQKYPELKYTPDSIGVEAQGLHYRFFDVMIDPESNRYLSEDYAFCKLWSWMGEKIYVDANSNLTHQGSKLYRGNFAESICSNLASAVGAPSGSQMIATGLSNLKPNESGPL